MGKEKLWSSLGLAAILALSAYIQFTVVSRTSVELSVGSDAADYFSYVYNLKYEGIYSNYRTWAVEKPPGGIVPDALRPPGYPLFLLAIPGVSVDDSYTHRVYMVQAGMGVGAVLLVYLIAGCFLRPGWAHLPPLLAATAPHLATISTNLLSESLFLFLLLAGIYTTILTLRTPRAWVMAITAGLLWGLCNLVRPTILPAIPCLLVAMMFVPALKGQRAKILSLALAFSLVQIPWIVRNMVAPLDTTQRSLMVDTLHHGSYPNFMYHERPETLGWPFRFDPNSERAERDLPSVLADIGQKFRDAPGTYLKWYLVGKPGAFLSWGYVEGRDIFVYHPLHSPFLEDRRFMALRNVALVLHWPLMLLGVLGAFLAFWRPGWLRLQGDAVIASRVVAALLIYGIAFHMVAAPFPRYGVPFRPLAYLLAITCVAAVSARRRPETNAGTSAVSPPDSPTGKSSSAAA